MPELKPVLVVVAGPNGSGKTSVTKILRNHHAWTSGLVEINPDDIARDEFGDWNNADAVRKAADRADAWREKCLAEQRGLLFETVLSTAGKIDYLRRARQAGYFIRLIYIATNSPQINLLRVAWRVSQGGHSVPAEKIISRYERSLKFSIPAAQLADRAYFMDNSRAATELPNGSAPYTIFRTVNGTVAKTYVAKEKFPPWAKPIYNALNINQQSAL